MHNSLIRFLLPLLSLQFWQLNVHTFRMKRSFRDLKNRPYTEYLSQYYASDLNPYYASIVDKWYAIRPVMLEMAELKAGERVLDLGTGLGFQAAAFAACGYGTIGVDLILDRLRLAGERHGGKTLHWVAANGVHLPFPSKSFDVLSMSLMLHDMPLDELQLVLSEARRVTCRRIVIAEPRLPEHWLLRPIYKNIAALFDESLYVKEYLEAPIERVFEMAALPVVNWQRCAQHTLAVYACNAMD